MTSLAMLGMLLAVVAVLAAYWVGHATGFRAGQEQGYGEGKREGAREGSMRGYAVGLDRGRRETADDHEPPPTKRGLGFGAVALVAAAVALFWLAAQSRQQSSSNSHTDSPPVLIRDVPRQVPEPTNTPPPVDVARPLLPVNK